ncbi:MAG: hypothetical protein LQ343_008054 [Gyalolechia ehrenbergii]|nr:MAG: hypothetical protein LQ343_008054 [Gyalolechia ehrenbergii]
MDLLDDSITRLRKQITETRSRLEKLTRRLAEAERQQSNQFKTPDIHLPHSGHDLSLLAPESNANHLGPSDLPPKWPLRAEEYKRYGRQMILPHIGLEGQLRLKNASVLIIGLGGLGCPAAAYLAGAGVGTIGLLDGDTVEISNLHRQILHNSPRLGQRKVASAWHYLRELNPLPTYRVHPEHLHPVSAVELFKQYDLILDCTDHPTSRYLISDTAVLTGKPLVSASALGMEGQLLVLNDPFPVNGDQPGRFCYRCVFPKPPPPETVLSCGEGGIFGPVVGVIGVLMATSAMKLLVRGDQSSKSHSSDGTFGVSRQPSMLLYSATGDPMFRTVKIKGKRDDCPSCSRNATISEGSLSSGCLDYVAFCGTYDSMEVLDPIKRTQPANYVEVRKWTPPSHCILIDVRSWTEYDVAKIDGSINIPIEEIKRASPLGEFLSRKLDRVLPFPRSEVDEPPMAGLRPEHKPFSEISIFTICRHGNDSQVAAMILANHYGCLVNDIQGGLDAWRKDVDPTFPDY